MSVKKVADILSLMDPQQVEAATDFQDAMNVLGGFKKREI